MWQFGREGGDGFEDKRMNKVKGKGE